MKKQFRHVLYILLALAITYSDQTSKMIALRAVEGGLSYQTNDSGSAVPFADTGMIRVKDYLTNVADRYVFEFAGADRGYTIKSRENSSYLARFVTKEENSAELRSFEAYDPTFC